MEPTGYIFRAAPLPNDPRAGYVFAAGQPPTLDTLNPATAVLGSPSFTLRVLGTNFTPQSVIEWNGSPERTTFVSPTELTTEVDMASAAVAGPIPVAVRLEQYLRTAPANFVLTAAGGE